MGMRTGQDKHPSLKQEQQCLADLATFDDAVPAAVRKASVTSEADVAGLDQVQQHVHWSLQLYLHNENNPHSWVRSGK